MEIALFSLLILFFTLLTPISVEPKFTALSSPYLSPTTLFQNYQNMMANFKIYIYSPPEPFTFATPPEFLFYDSLLNSSFVTQNPNDAHLFFVPFRPDLSPRAISRLIRDLRTRYPYWDRALGADHFFLSRTGIDYASDRNVLELKKNSVQISCFPTTSGNFVPHKDISLPPLNPPRLALPHAPVNGTKTVLGYMRWKRESESRLVNELDGDSDFVIESEPSDLVGSSKFCLFVYDVDVLWIREALASGCVPVVITDRPIQDLPLMDVLRWPEIAVFVGTRGGVKELKKVLRWIGVDQYERMRGLGVTASQHLVWNASPQPHDAFHMVLYQLWLRRHTIRYARREGI